MPGFDLKFVARASVGYSRAREGEVVIAVVDHHHLWIARCVDFMVENAANDLFAHAAGALVNVVALHVRGQEIDLSKDLGARPITIGAKDFVFAGN